MLHSLESALNGAHQISCVHTLWVFRPPGFFMSMQKTWFWPNKKKLFFLLRYVHLQIRTSMPKIIHKFKFNPYGCIHFLYMCLCVSMCQYAVQPLSVYALRISNWLHWKQTTYSQFACIWIDSLAKIQNECSTAMCIIWNFSPVDGDFGSTLFFYFFFFSYSICDFFFQVNRCIFIFEQCKTIRLNWMPQHKRWFTRPHTTARLSLSFALSNKMH